MFVILLANYKAGAHGTSPLKRPHNGVLRHDLICPYPSSVLSQLQSSLLTMSLMAGLWHWGFVSSALAGRSLLRCPQWLIEQPSLCTSCWDEGLAKPIKQCRRALTLWVVQERFDMFQTEQDVFKKLRVSQNFLQDFTKMKDLFFFIVYVCFLYQSVAKLKIFTFNT